MFLRLEFHFYGLREILTVLAFSGAIILLPVFALMSRFLISQGCKRILALARPWSWIELLRRPVLLAGLGSS